MTVRSYGQEPFRYAYQKIENLQFPAFICVYHPPEPEMLNPYRGYSHLRHEFSFAYSLHKSWMQAFRPAHFLYRSFPSWFVADERWSHYYYYPPKVFVSKRTLDQIVRKKGLFVLCKRGRGVPPFKEDKGCLF
jgi:hypothetical protein